MKKIKYIALSVCAALSLTSCNDFLDKLPDDRAEIDSNTKITNLLVSAYPAVSNIMLNEMSTDNVSDNGKQYTTCLLYTSDAADD